MYDFPEFLTGKDYDQVKEITEFLELFFKEEIGCGVRLRNGNVAGGGPVWFEHDGPDAWWNEDGAIIRSWRGNRDRS